MCVYVNYMYRFHINDEVVSTRIATVTAYKLAQFRETIVKTKPEVLRAQVGDILIKKQTQAQETAIADAVAKAKAEPRGMFGMFV